MKDTFDIAIIGAGPAGTACALALRGSGLKVALIDKSIFPRDKICGDAIPGPAFKAMDKINPIWGKAMRAFTDKHEIRTGRMFSPNGKSISLDWVTYAYNSKRIDFDNFLIELVRKETTTAILENKRLKSIELQEDGVCCQFQDETEIFASIVIGCDGANSFVKRKLAEDDKTNEHACSAVRAYYSNVTGIEEGDNELHFFKDLLPGYFWIFPLDNGWVNVGFGILQEKFGGKKLPMSLRHTMEDILQNRPQISERFKNAILHQEIKSFGLPLGIEQKSVSGNRFMLCGDAASIIDPLQGHGIDYAMWSGYFAAIQAQECFKMGKFDAQTMKNYDAQLFAKIGPELKRNTFLLKLISKAPWILSLAILLGQNKKWTQRVVRFLKI